jgi:hypothetical protein
MPNSPDNQSAPQDVSLSQGDPYRTPSEVPAVAKRGWLKSPLTWLAIAGVLAGAIVMLARKSSVTDHISDFGMFRSGAPEGIAEQEVSLAED